jgi:4-amino-4-deoxy-L-arabinose transferase-like glycosyltransferase
LKATTLLLAVIPVLLVGLVSLHYTALAADEYTYLNTAHSFLSGQYSSISDPSRFPLYPFTLSLVYRVFGESLTTAKVFNLVLVALSSVLVALLAEEMFGEKAGVWAALLAGTAPLVLYLATTALTEPLFILLSTICIYTIYKSGKDIKWLAAFGLAEAALFLTRYTGIYLFLVAGAYVLYKHGLNLKVVGYCLLCGFFFFLALSPWLYASIQLTGSPGGFFLTFLHDQTGAQTGLTLPDKIPSYLLAIPFLLGFATVLWIWAQKDLRENWREPNKVFLLMNLLIPALVLEASGLLHPRLLRYAAPLSPVLAILFAGSLAWALTNLKLLQSKGRLGEATRLVKQHEKLLMGAFFVLNLLVAVGVVVYFGHYTKHVAYQQVGEFAQLECASAYSNIPFALQYYIGSANTATPQQAQCVVDSTYDGTVAIPNGYTQVYDKLGITVYKQ